MKFGTDYQALAHHWVYNNDYSSCYGDRMYSANDVIYSYGSHFRIARKIRDKKGNFLCFVLNTDRSSNTTSKQQSCVESALPYHEVVIEISNCEWEDSVKVMADFKNKYNEFMVLAEKAKSKKQDYLDSAERIVSFMRKYLEYSKKSGVVVDKRKIGRFWLDIIKNGVSEDSIEASILNKEKERKRVASEKARKNRVLHLKELEILAEWKRGVGSRSPYLSTISDAHLRIKDDMVESSQGSSVSVLEAKILARKIRNKENIKGFVLNGFTVISYDGSLTIGCHKIEKNEVDRILKELI